MELPADILRYVDKAFAAPDRPAALQLLGTAVLHDGTPASPRLMRCALITSGGTLQGLRGQVERMSVDFRDVILEGEYAPGEGGPVRVRDLNQPFKHE